VLCGVEAQLASKKSEISVHGRTGLTRIRLQPAIYFFLHRGSLPENTARRQALFQGDEHITALL
jgi:hypothetical protein